MQKNEMIDVKRGIMYCGEDEDIYLTIIESFCKDGQKRMESIKDSIQDEDYETYEREVHSLKSVAATIGAISLAEIATKHNAQCKKKDYLFIKQDGEKLIHTYEEVIAELQNIKITMQK